MKKLFCSVIIFIIVKRNCAAENNVCKTIQDYYTINNNNNCKYDVAADPAANPTTIIGHYGYPAETHKVTTLDGYILTMFRIPNYHIFYKKGPVFLQHGMIASASSFLGLGSNSLAFLLADAGYDVWLGSNRGTKYSEEHVNLTISDRQYWDYSIDEIALNDIPAQLGYVSQATGNEGNMVYIGHALGSMVGLMCTSTFPEDTRNILKLMIILAPSSDVPRNNRTSILERFLAPLTRPLLQIARDSTNNLIRFVLQNNIVQSLTRRVCYHSPFLLQNCIKTLTFLAGGPQIQLEPQMIPIYFNNLPTGSSFKVLTQAADLSKGNFRRYDYVSQNLEKYGSSEPPPYDLGRVQIPVFMVNTINDWFVTPEDALKLYTNLPRMMRYGKHEIRVRNFNQNDFLYGRNVKMILYDLLLRVVNSI